MDEHAWQYTIDGWLENEEEVDFLYTQDSEYLLYKCNIEFITHMEN